MYFPDPLIPVSYECDALFRYVEGLRHEFDENRRRPPLRPNEPPYAGSAVWAHSLARGVEEAWSHLKNLRHMAKVSVRCDLYIMYFCFISGTNAFSDQPHIGRQ